MSSELPIPSTQLFYADLSINPQNQLIAPLITNIHYPTLGCPALLGPDAQLQVLLSLPAANNARGVTFHLRDRHQRPDASFPVSRQGDPELISELPGSGRRLWRYWLGVADVPFALFDLHAAWDGGNDVQYNAVRRYQAITGREQVIFCGDSHYNGDNRICLANFITSVNRLDVAWIALIGDICDNGVKGTLNMLRLGATAHPGPVTPYYRQEYPQSHELLRQLRHPVFVVPGNHDGMAANDSYQEGHPSQVVTGPDPANAVAYDGLHHFRCTFGPLFFRLDWAGTRYLFANSFELTRQQRLGYHAVVANWGGWMNREQMDWLKQELKTAPPGQRQVLLIHHDLRGGSVGKRVGYYHRFRPYKFDHRWPILKAYLAYLLGHGNSMWQQEWMAPEKGELADHPVKEVLADLLEHQVWAVIMGHDNENWVDSYSPGDDLFNTQSTMHTFARPEEADGQLVDAIMDKLEQADYAGLAKLLEATDKKTGQTALSAALGKLEHLEAPAAVMFAPDPATTWGLAVKSRIHFIHVDDVGAYDYDDASDLDKYGFVLAQLDGGAPVKVQSHRLSGSTGKVFVLEKD